MSNSTENVNLITVKYWIAYFISSHLININLTASYRKHYALCAMRIII